MRSGSWTPWRDRLLRAPVDRAAALAGYRRRSGMVEPLQPCRASKFRLDFTGPRSYSVLMALRHLKRAARNFGWPVAGRAMLAAVAGVALGAFTVWAIHHLAPNQSLIQKALIGSYYDAEHK
jgi:hypothetical protein